MGNGKWSGKSRHRNGIGIGIGIQIGSLERRVAGIKVSNRRGLATAWESFAAVGLSGYCL